MTEKTTLPTAPTVEVIKYRVARGAALLDGHMPGWWRDSGVDLSRFDMSIDCRCVIGQLSPARNYGDAIRNRWLDLDSALAVDCGFYSQVQAATDAVLAEADFDAVIDEINIEYISLTAEWERVITERRARVATT